MGEYENFLAAIRQPHHPEHEEYLNWIGGVFDPEAFDLEGINRRLHRMGRGRSTEALGPWSVEEEELAPDWLEAESHAGQPLSEDYRIAAEELPLRRDLVALLAYLREHRVTGTQSRGNLPLKAVREICARFVQPPELETRIGRYTHVVRSEDEVGPLLFRHLLLYVGGLVSGGRGRRWRLTGRGVRFLSEPAPLQVVSVLEAWWARANWAVLSPFAFEGGSVPARFPELALAHLLDLRVGEEVPFELFADRLIEGSRMAWPIQNQESARRILGTIVERTLIEPMVEFGILAATHSPRSMLGAEFQELSSFRVTPFGQPLLEAVRDALRSHGP